MQRPDSRAGAPTPADGIRPVEVHHPRRQGAPAGDHREERSPASDGGDTGQGAIGRQTAVRRQTVEPDAEGLCIRHFLVEITLQKDFRHKFRML